MAGTLPQLYGGGDNVVIIIIIAPKHVLNELYETDLIGCGFIAKIRKVVRCNTSHCTSTETENTHVLLGFHIAVLLL